MPEYPARVSIIVTCYNYGHFLPDALNSIAGQEYRDWECIIIDDGSTDNTAAVAAGYVAADPRFRYIHQVNAGLSAARNTGIRAAAGGYIQFLDADDALAPEKLRLQLAYLDAHPEASLVYGETDYFSPDRPELHRRRTDIAVPDARWKRNACGPELLQGLVRENIFVVSAPLIRLTAVQRTGLFEPELRSYEDWQYWFRMAEAGACFHYWGEPGTESRIRYGHVSMMRNHVRMNEAGIRLRRFFAAALTGSAARYNRFRLVRLRAKQAFLRLRRLWNG